MNENNQSSPVRGPGRSESDALPPTTPPRGREGRTRKRKKILNLLLFFALAALIYAGINFYLFFNRTHLVLQVRPEGVEIVIDNQLRLVSQPDQPHVITDLEPGPHTLRAQKPGYITAAKDFKVLRGKKTELDLELQKNPLLNIKVSPPDAQVTIDGTPVATEKFSGRLQLQNLFAGQHTIVVSHPRRLSHEESFTLDPGQELTLEIILEKRPTLAIKVEPADAELSINEKMIALDDSGRVTLEELTPGSHRIEATHPDFLGHSESVLLEPDRSRELLVTLKRYPRLKLQVSPPDARVTIDGLAVELDPETGTTVIEKLSVGGRQLEVRHPEYLLHSRPLLLNPDQELALEVKLKKKPTLFLKVDPPRAQVRIEQKEIALDPEGKAVLTDLGEGPYPLEASHRGYQTHKQDLVLKPGEKKKLELELTRLPVLKLKVSPARAFVTLDGEGIYLDSRTGESFWIPMTPGRHELKVEARGFETHEAAIEPSSGDRNDAPRERVMEIKLNPRPEPLDMEARLIKLSELADKNNLKIGRLKPGKETPGQGAPLDIEGQGEFNNLLRFLWEAAALDGKKQPEPESPLMLCVNECLARNCAQSQNPADCEKIYETHCANETCQLLRRQWIEARKENAGRRFITFERTLEISKINSGPGLKFRLRIGVAAPDQDLMMLAALKKITESAPPGLWLTSAEIGNEGKIALAGESWTQDQAAEFARNLFLISCDNGKPPDKRSPVCRDRDRACTPPTTEDEDATDPEFAACREFYLQTRAEAHDAQQAFRDCRESAAKEQCKATPDETCLEKAGRKSRYGLCLEPWREFMAAAARAERLFREEWIIVDSVKLSTTSPKKDPGPVGYSFVLEARLAPPRTALTSPPEPMADLFQAPTPPDRP